MNHKDFRQSTTPGKWGAKMGTGSFGGGGSGALGRAGSGAGGVAGFAGRQGSAGNFFDARKADGRAPTPSDSSALLRETFAQRNVARFVQQVVSSDQVRGCYEEFFNLAVLLTQQHDWTALQHKYGVTADSGCLANLAEVIASAHVVGGREIHREIARSAVLDVLLAAVGGDDDVFLEGNATAVFDSVSKHRHVFESVSSHFLASVINRLALRELPALNTLEAEAIRLSSVQRADRIIDSFERTWQYAPSGEKQLSHKQLLQTICQQGEWFENKLREKTKT
ncbi:hypothetical protein AB4Y40_41710 [Paraburkholderia sp. EG287B]|uniref:hypothetical protein n=1 Tax=Paraburkholderia sp. EG287B TaxID=3237010 RepID=UPI0034D20EEB